MQQTLSVYNLRRQDIRVTQIKYLEGSGNYSIIHLANRKPIVLSRSIVTFEQELPTFVRIHKKYLVNPQFVIAQQRPTPRQLMLKLTSGQVLAVSRRRITQVLAALAQASL